MINKDACTVRDLIEKLRNFDLNLPVYINDIESGIEPFCLDYVCLVKRESYYGNRIPEFRVQL